MAEIRVFVGTAFYCRLDRAAFDPGLVRVGGAFDTPYGRLAIERLLRFTRSNHLYIGLEQPRSHA